MTLGNRIKEAAEEIGGLTRLADTIDTPRRTVGNWVDGSTEPKATVVAQIALSTGVSVKWLVLGLGPKFEEALYGGLFQTTDNQRSMERNSGADIDIRDADGTRVLIQVKRSPIEFDALVKLHKIVKKVHGEAGIRLQETDVLRMASEAYNDFVADQVDFADEDEIGARMVLLEKKIQRLVSAARAEPGTGKRSAS